VSFQAIKFFSYRFENDGQQGYFSRVGTDGSGRLFEFTIKGRYYKKCFITVGFLVETARVKRLIPRLSGLLTREIVAESHKFTAAELLAPSAPWLILRIGR
jgi:hypothetical protein